MHQNVAFPAIKMQQIVAFPRKDKISKFSGGGHRPHLWGGYPLCTPHPLDGFGILTFSAPSLFAGAAPAGCGWQDSCIEVNQETANTRQKLYSAYQQPMTSNGHTDGTSLNTYAIARCVSCSCRLIQLCQPISTIF